MSAVASNPVSERTLLLIRGNRRLQGNACPQCGKTVDVVDVNSDFDWVVLHEGDEPGYSTDDSTCQVVPE